VACSSFPPSPAPRVPSGLLDTLDAYREGLALARRAGMSWFQAEPAACDSALKAAPSEAGWPDWVLYDTRTAWQKSFRRAETPASLCRHSDLPRLAYCAPSRPSFSHALPLVSGIQGASGKQGGGGIVPREGVGHRVARVRSAIQYEERGATR
jgi:hypothetical protein